MRHSVWYPDGLPEPLHGRLPGKSKRLCLPHPAETDTDSDLNLCRVDCSQIALAALYELSHNYMLGEIFFMAISLVGILTALVLFIVDERTGAVLRLRSIKNMGASPRHHANYDNASRSPLPSNTILSTPPVRIQARMAVQTPPTTSPQPSSSSERNYLRPPDAVKYGTQQTPTGKR